MYYLLKNYKTSMALSLILFCGCQSKKIPLVDKKPVVEYKTASSASLRSFTQVILNNGLKIYFISDKSLPRLSLNLLLKTGQIYEENNLSGINFLTAHLLDKGTSTKTAGDLADQTADLGASFNAQAGNDFTVFSMDALTPSQDLLLQLFSDIIRNPKFEDTEIRRLKKLVLASLEQKKDDPASFADQMASEYLFLAHPYGRDGEGSKKSLANINKKQIIQYYLNHYRPNNAILAVAGNFDEDFKRKVAENFSSWVSRPTKVNLPAEISPLSKTEFRFIHKSGLNQVQLRFMQPGLRRTDTEYLQLRLINSALGGDFLSRLNQTIRYKLGLTYSISSSFASFQQKGSFEISTFTKNQSTAQVIDTTLDIVREFVKSGLTESELESAKKQALGQFPRTIETVDSFAFNLMILDYYGISYDYLKNFDSELKKVSLNQINATLRKILDPDKFKVLIYGDRSKIQPQLKKYSPEILN
ncbi:MAG: M16 family metallopeptidase [Pseudobdellovibrionaceae bacterium]